MTIDIVGAAANTPMSHAYVLETLARTDGDAIKAFAETLLPELGPVEVLSSRTGLVMLPFVDTVLNTAFHLGEVLVAEAHIRLDLHPGHEGYGAIVGRDLQRSMAMAVVDAALSAGVGQERIAHFIEEQAARQMQADEAHLQKVEATRVRMETF